MQSSSKINQVKGQLKRNTKEHIFKCETYQPDVKSVITPAKKLVAKFTEVQKGCNDHSALTPQGINHQKKQGPPHLLNVTPLQKE